ncbi:MAG: aldo/keto reductase [Syntrophaceae bacterium]
MQYQELGRTGLSIARISAGTVELGVDYGIQAPGDYGRPTRQEAVALIRAAHAGGINLFDTAPAYGESERILGEALAGCGDAYVATKVSIPLNPDGTPIRGAQLKQTVRQSIRNSLKRLRRDVLDIVQIHNATQAVVAQGEMAETLLEAREDGLIRFLGASVYTVPEALDVIAAGCFDTLQIAYSLLDRRMASTVFPAAELAGVGIISRSGLLKGVLSAKAQWLPPELSTLRTASEKVRKIIGEDWDGLPAAAIRFCLSTPAVGTVLVGLRTGHELEQALAAGGQGGLPTDILHRLETLMPIEERLLNPANWSLA